MIDLTFERKMRPKYSFQVSDLAFSRPPSEPRVKKKKKNSLETCFKNFQQDLNIQKVETNACFVVVFIIIIVVNQTIQNMRKLLG